MIEMTKEQKIELSVKMVILDAIEKGNHDKEKLIEYMKTDVFQKAAQSYIKQM